MRLAIISVGIFLIAAHTTYAEDGVSSGSGILKGCEALSTNTTDHLDAVTTNEVFLCFGAITAIQQAMLAHKEYCPSNNVQNVDVYKAVVLHMKAHPLSLNEGYGLLIYTALQEAWPCKNTGWFH